MNPFNPFTQARQKRVKAKQAKKIARRKRNRSLGGGLFKPVQPRKPAVIRSVESRPRRFHKFRD